MPKPTPGRLEAATPLLFEEGRRAWQGLDVPPESFARYLQELGLERAPELARAADLYLACACVHSVPGALEAFDRAYLSKVGALLSRRRPSPAFVDEVRQTVGVRLLVGSEGQPRRIAEYRGEGSLLAWLRIAVLRTAINLELGSRHALERKPGAPSATSADAVDLDPELTLLKQRYEKPFNEAFRRAIGALSPEQRGLLQSHYAEGRTLEWLAEDLGVHRATVARRLAAIREAVIDEARRLLRAELGASHTELESLLRLMRSRIDLSLKV